MKKIIALFVLVFGISFTASAQENSSEDNIHIESKTLALKIKDYLKLDDVKTKAVYEIIQYKTSTILNEPNLIEERKQVIINKFTKKLEGSLSAEEFNKLKSNKTLFSEFQKV